MLWLKLLKLILANALLYPVILGALWIFSYHPSYKLTQKIGTRPPSDFSSRMKICSLGTLIYISVMVGNLTYFTTTCCWLFGFECSSIVLNNLLISSISWSIVFLWPWGLSPRPSWTYRRELIWSYRAALLWSLLLKPFLYCSWCFEWSLFWGFSEHPSSQTSQQCKRKASFSLRLPPSGLISKAFSLTQYQQEVPWRSYWLQLKFRRRGIWGLIVVLLKWSNCRWVQVWSSFLEARRSVQVFSPFLLKSTALRILYPLSLACQR